MKGIKPYVSATMSLQITTAYSERSLMHFFIYSQCFHFSHTYTKLYIFYKTHLCQTEHLFLRNAAHDEKVNEAHIKSTHTTKEKQKWKNMQA